MSDGNLSVIAKPHPFDDDIYYTQAQQGQTLAQMLGQAASHSLRVEIGGQEVPQALWKHVKPKAGQRIYVTAFPQGGGNGAKWIRIVAMVVITILSYGAASGWFAAGSYFAAGSASAAALAAGISIVGTLAINALVPPPTAKGLGGAGGDPFQ